MSLRNRTLKPLVTVVEVNPDAMARFTKFMAADDRVDLVDLGDSPTLPTALTNAFPVDDGADIETVWRGNGLKNRLALIVNADLMDSTDVDFFWRAVFRGYDKGPTVVLVGRPGVGDLLGNEEFIAGHDFTVLQITH